MLAVVGLISFIVTMNEFVIASVLLQTTDKLDARRSGCAATSTSSTAQHWGPFAAGVLLAAIPVTALFMGLQKFIVGGLTAGAVKG